MARLAFHYLSRRSFLHNWSARCKLPGLIILSIGLLHMQMKALGLFTLLISFLAISISFPLAQIFRELRSWVLFLCAIFLLQAISLQDGSQGASSWFSITRQSLFFASLACWRLGLVLLYAILFMSVTSPRELQDALLYYLRPFPTKLARRLVLLITITIRSIPLLLDQAEEIGLAIMARSGNRRKEPLRRIKYSVMPLLRRSLLRSDELALAIIARGYREDLPVCLEKTPLFHWIALLGLAVLVAGSTRILDG